MLHVVPAGHTLSTFEFVTLRLGDHCVPAIEILTGEDALIDELPEEIDRDALRAWLAAHGLTEIRSHSRRLE